MANHYHESWAVINEVLRPSVEVESLERALKPITAHVSAVVPAVDEKTKQRSATVVDYDSYRRRLKEKEVARDAAEAEKANLDAQGKPFKSTDAIRQEVTPPLIARARLSMDGVGYQVRGQSRHSREPSIRPDGGTQSAAEGGGRDERCSDD